MARLPPRPDWSRPLPRPIVIPTVLQLTTLADVRSLIERHLASNRRVVPTWRYVRQKLDEAARGGDAMDLAVALQIALHLEGVECQAEAAPVSAALDGREQAQSFNAHVANQACTMLQPTLQRKSVQAV